VGRPGAMTDDAVRWFDHEADDYFRRHRTPSEDLTELLPFLRPGSRVLDLGCGPGTEAGHLASLGHQVLAIDAAPAMLAIARRQHPRVEFRQGDMRALDLPPGSFDVVSALYSLIFLGSAEFDEVLRRIRRWLAPEGLLFVVAQGGAPAEPGVAALFRLMPMEELAARLRSAGFEVVRSSERPPRPEERQFKKLRVVARRV